jgi:hypothetical protein
MWKKNGRSLSLCLGRECNPGPPYSSRQSTMASDTYNRYKSKTWVQLQSFTGHRNLMCPLRYIISPFCNTERWKIHASHILGLLFTQKYRLKNMYTKPSLIRVQLIRIEIQKLKILFTIEYTDESLVCWDKTSQVSSNIHYYVQKKVKLPLSMNKCMVFL